MMEKITFIYSYYENPEMLKYQQEVWSQYSREYKDMFEIIVVDDGSQESPAMDVIEDAWYNFRLYRIKVDVPWNQTSARNLAAYKADKNSWLFLTDMDHVLDSKNHTDIMSILKEETHFNRNFYYTMDRLNGPERGEYKHHPNSFIMHRDLYMKVGGYDEEFAGKVYATDGMFRKSLKAAAQNYVHLSGLYIIRFGREHIADASTRNLKRGREFQIPEVLQAVKERDKIKRTRGERPLVLSFPWEELI